MIPHPNAFRIWTGAQWVPCFTRRVLATVGEIDPAIDLTKDVNVGSFAELVGIAEDTVAWAQIVGQTTGSGLGIISTALTNDALGTVFVRFIDGALSDGLTDFGDQLIQIWVGIPEP